VVGLGVVLAKYKNILVVKPSYGRRRIVKEAKACSGL
jgi:hypothetical protein